jgi:hypothetical protein
LRKKFTHLLYNFDFCQATEVSNHKNAPEVKPRDAAKPKNVTEIKQMKRFKPNNESIPSVKASAPVKPFIGTLPTKPNGTVHVRVVNGTKPAVKPSEPVRTVNGNVPVFKLPELVHQFNRSIIAKHSKPVRPVIGTGPVIKPIKGIVSPDWKGLQMISLDRFEV